MIRITVQDRCFGDNFVLVLCEKSQCESWLLKTYKVEHEIQARSSGEFIRCDSPKGGYDYVVWMPDFDWTIGDQRTLTHELLHCVMGCLKRRGVEIEEGIGEVVCYLYSYLFGEFYCALKKWYEKKSAKVKKTARKKK